MPRFFVPFRPFLLAVPVLAAASNARAQDPAPVAATPTFAGAGEAVPTPIALGAAAPRPVSRAQFFNALGEQVGFVGALRSWRETFRAGGNVPRRELWRDSLAGGQLALSLGQVRTPGLAGFNAGAGTAFSWRGKNGESFDAGTTARPQRLDQLLQGFDAQMSDAPGAKTHAPLGRAGVTWLRAKPLSDGRAELEATLLRAARDEQSGQGERWKSGTFADVDARLALPTGWQLRGSWSSARFDGQNAHSRWNAEANGLLAHPWGQADVKLDWKTTDAGFATFSGTSATGESTGDAQLSQSIKTALVSGTLVAAASTRFIQQTDAAHPNDELSRDTARANADLKVQLAPNFALSAAGNVEQVGVERAPAAFGSPLRESHLAARGDVGVDWKVSKQLSIGAGAGLSQSESAGGAASDRQSQENRATLRLCFARAKENYAFAFQMRDRDLTGQNPSANEGRWAHLVALKLETERPLIGDWRLSAGANWMIDRQAAPDDARGVARQIVAGLQFARAARLDVRYRDGAALPFDLQDPLGAAFSSSLFAQGHREIATRFNIGSAAGSSGLGLALEWARQGATSSPNDSWKIGLTYR